VPISSSIHRKLLGGSTLAAAVSVLALYGPSGAPATIATAARTMSLSDSGHLHLSSHKGFTLNEVGSASGTISGSLYLHLHVVSTNRVSAELSVYPSGSSMTGVASGSYRNNGSTASFTGTMSIVRGTGKYAHARGSGLSFSGTVQRSNDAVTVHVSGKLTY
jgi:hypothetical protein